MLDSLCWIVVSRAFSNKSQVLSELGSNQKFWKIVLFCISNLRCYKSISLTTISVFNLVITHISASTKVQSSSGLLFFPIVYKFRKEKKCLFISNRVRGCLKLYCCSANVSISRNIVSDKNKMSPSVLKLTINVFIVFTSLLLHENLSHVPFNFSYLLDAHTWWNKWIRAEHC